MKILLYTGKVMAATAVSIFFLLTLKNGYMDAESMCFYTVAFSAVGLSFFIKLD